MNQDFMKGLIWTLLLAILIIPATDLHAQKDPVLFTVDKKDVHVSEFEYIYSKTNGKSASFSEASLNEYLDLYKKFKLKVAAAKEMKLDTIPALIQELDGYRRQLADSYLTDREVTEKLTKEVYQRSQKDISMSHLLIRMPENALHGDTLDTYNKIMGYRNKIVEGENFALVAKMYSEDKGTKDKGGSLGFLVAPFPNGFYALETAAYNTKEGEVSMPVRTKLGYHLIKVHHIRPARGELEAAHILIRVDEKQNNMAAAKATIDSLYKVLEAGGDFKAIAKKHSQDKATAVKDGYIGFFGVNRFQKDFEDAAFALKTDGAFTKPVRSPVGFHIIQRVSKRDSEEYKMAKRRLQPKIKKDARFDLAKNAMIERIKTEGKFTENKVLLNTWLNGLVDQFLTFKWKPAATANEEVLFSFENGLSFSVNDFEKHCQKNSRARIRKAANANPRDVANDLYNGFVTDACIKYEESQLEKKYPEFKALMREYEEGILLFEATKINVWDKASQDTVGLKAFYAKNKNNYMWGDRAKVSVITVSPEGKKMMSKINKYARSHNAEEIANKFNKGDATIIAVTEQVLEKGKDELLDATDWTVGANTEIRIDNKTKNLSFMQIKEVIAPTPKSLNESRGYVIADYQDQLEKEWIESLRKKYKIKVNEKVFQNLIK